MRTGKLIFIAALLPVLFCLGCSDDDKGTDGDNNGDQSVTASIGPEGGSLSIPGEVTLVIVTGALSETIDFTITKSDALAPPPGTRAYVSPNYSVEPSGTNFDIPAAITIKYNPALLGGADEQSVEVFCRDASGWEAAPTTVSAPTDQAIGVIDHLSDFAVLADTSSPAEGVFGLFVVARSVMFIEQQLFRMDMILTRFDSAFAPCDTVKPQQAGGVACNQYTLDWSTMFKRHEYLGGMVPFIELGETYIFDVTAKAAVPAMTDSVDFPNTETYITSPLGGATVNKSGFAVSWAGYGSGEVRLVLVSDVGDTSVVVETANDGNYSFSQSQLSGVFPGEHAIVLFHENTNYVDAAGYDPRSVMKARVMSTVMVDIQ